MQVREKISAITKHPCTVLQALTGAAFEQLELTVKPDQFMAESIAGFMAIGQANLK